MLRNKVKKSFTLVEIIIVISIISILSTVGAGAYTNFKYKLSFEANYQQIMKFFENARQFAMTGIKLKDGGGNLVAPKYFKIIVTDSNEVKFDAYVEETGDPIVIDDLKLNSRYSINFVDSADVALSLPVNITYTVAEDGVSIAVTDASVSENSIYIILSDTQIEARKKTIYINSRSGVAELSSLPSSSAQKSGNSTQGLHL